MKQTKFSIYGALIGDFYGSYWEFRADKPKDEKDALILREGCTFTDDTLMTLAIAKAVMEKGDVYDNAIKWMRKLGNKYQTSYGGSFSHWLNSSNPQPYNSWGNGASMRISPVALLAKSWHEAQKNCFLVTATTHNHNFALNYASLVTKIIFYAKKYGMTMDKIKSMIRADFPYEADEIFSRLMNIEYLHKEYKFTESSQGTVPQAVRCFLESSSFADCLAKALYVGGDSDTLAAIACSMAAPFYGDEQVIPFVKKIPSLSKELDNILKQVQIAQQ